MRLALIPISHRGNVIFQWQITPARLPAQGLNGDLQVRFRIYRIGDMPAIESETLTRLISNIRR